MTWRWTRPVPAPCNVAGGSGMKCHGIRPKVCRIGILHLVSILTISPQSKCLHQSAKFYPNETTLSRKKWRHVDFQYGGSRPSLILGGPIMGSLKSPCTTSYSSSIDTIALNCLVFERNRVLAFWRQDPIWRISAILDFRGPITGYLKSRCTTSYRSSIDII